MPAEVAHFKDDPLGRMLTLPNRLRGRVGVVSSLPDILISTLIAPSVGLLSDRMAGDPAGLLKAIGLVCGPCCVVALLLLSRVKRPMLRMAQREAPA